MLQRTKTEAAAGPKHFPVMKTADKKAIGDFINVLKWGIEITNVYTEGKLFSFWKW